VEFVEHQFEKEEEKKTNKPNQTKTKANQSKVGIDILRRKENKTK